MPFSSFGLDASLVQAIADLGYITPTPVQAAAIGSILEGRDVLVLAQTGSGKTAAFCLPMLHRLQFKGAGTPGSRGAGRTPVRALVLVPTRELAVQIGQVIQGLSRFLPVPVKTVVVFGGVSINPQMMALRAGADIVVATPGRLLDLVDRNALDLARVETLVLDEADRLLDLGFTDEITRILKLLPRKGQRLFFSATFPPDVQALAANLLNNPMQVEVKSTAKTEPDILQRAIDVDASRRTQLLRHLIQQERWARVLVFVATKFAAEIVADKLRKANINAEPFHGLLSQGKRSQVLADFKASRVQVVVATDLAARGIDIADLPVVVNYDLPRSADDYLHRIGRTGRAGESGLAVSFISANTAAHFRLIEKRQGLKIKRAQLLGFEPVDVLDAEPDPGTGGVKGSRPSKKDKLRNAARATGGLP
jgi:ATP-dependent RNA helicase RhlE